MTAPQNGCDEVEKFSGIVFASCELFLNISGSHILQDNNDFKKMLQWLDQHNPFPELPS